MRLVDLIVIEALLAASCGKGATQTAKDEPAPTPPARVIVYVPRDPEPIPVPTVDNGLYDGENADIRICHYSVETTQDGVRRDPSMSYSFPGEANFHLRRHALDYRLTHGECDDEEGEEDW